MTENTLRRLYKNQVVNADWRSTDFMLWESYESRRYTILCGQTAVF
jgi:hypothetical protein